MLRYVGGAQQVGGIGDAVLGDDVAVAQWPREPCLGVVCIARVKLREHVDHAGGRDAAAVARVLDLMRQRGRTAIVDDLLAVVIDAAEVEHIAQHVDEEVPRKELEEKLRR
eukprot:scaffold218899_cov24-Tisochrysis_lutea.AAC.2